MLHVQFYSKGIKRGAMAVVLLACLFALAGCSQSPQSPSVPQTYIEIEPQGSDKKLNQDKILEQQATSSMWLQVNYRRVVDAHQVFNLITELMELGDREGHEPARKLGHFLVQTLYGNPDNSMQVLPEYSLYLDVALGEKKPILLGILDGKIAGLQQSYPIISQVLKESALLSEAFASVSLQGVGTQLRSFLAQIASLLKLRGASIEVVKAFQAELDEKYFPMVDRFGAEISQVSISQPLSKNLTYIKSIESLPLDTQTISQIRTDLEMASRLERDIAQMSNGKQGLAVILNLWLMLRPEQRQQYFQKVSPDLYEHLKDKDEAYIVDLKNGSWTNLWTYIPYWKITSKLEDYGVAKLRDELLPMINSFVLQSFEKQLKAQLVRLPQMMESRFIQTVKAKELNVQTIREKTYRDFFADLSVNWGKKEIYGEKKTINGFEKDRYVFGVKEGGNYLLIPDSRVSPHLTSSSSIGSSMALASKRLQKVAEYESVSYSSDAYYRLVLEVLNKMPAVGGFKRIDDNLFPSFHVAINEPSPYSKIMDIKTQFGSNEYFVVPDYISLKSVNEMSRSDNRDDPFFVSVRGQAELLSGFSGLMEFFRDWTGSTFDIKMGQFVLGHLIPDLPPHLEFEPLFPKEKIFEYCLGVSSIILENLKRPRSGVFFLTKDLKWISSESLDEAKKEQALMAGYVDRTQNGLGDEMKSADISRFILAMTKFLEATEGIEKSRSLVVKDKMSKIIEARSQVKLLTFMMGNFLVRQMQRPDGSMSSVYSLKENKIITKSLHLEDQLETIRAFTAIEKNLKMSEFKARAYEIYFSLSQHFWDEQQGFYSAVMSDDYASSFKKPDPRLFILSLRALSDLKALPGRDYSDGQISFLLRTFLGQIQ
ncbi:MAG: hypothetical protein AB7F59_09735 [Bdellovibrionales bacterium]